MSTSVELDNGQRFHRLNPRDGSQMYRLVQEQLDEHPYRTVLLAGGVGFVLGAGLLRHAAGRLLVAGLRAGMAAVVAPIATHIVDEVRAGRKRQSRR